LATAALAHLADDRREGLSEKASAASAMIFSAILDRLREDDGG